MKTLYIVATPIGNLQDITLRAAQTLLSAPYIIAESASKTNNLLNSIRLNFPNIPNSPNRPKIISYTEDEEENKLPYVMRILEESDAALTSEAGTPLVSDPGFKLVREAIRKGVRIVPIPGPSSVTAALSVSGLPTNKVTFIGFLPKSDSKRKKELLKLRETNSTIILFESPYRLTQTLIDIQDVFGDLEVVAARELTKIHEEVIRGRINDLLSKFEQKSPKGEFVILFCN
ncbi:MAG: 16S rRNA (cytidine(1402)-2'-O)-methyltransferase [Candidatus Levybacteria bacterium]|nr:16S rRNA (cytidine(1402)-2'-O)-methyltransferase [Candidatus Levybacteria bacterium]